MNLNFNCSSGLNSNRSLFIIALAIAALTFAVYSGSLYGEFINYDDKSYLFENPVIKQIDLASLLSMLTSSHAGWWMPLTWLSFAIDYQIWGLNPFGFHLVNSLIHAANTALVVIIAFQVLTVVRDREKLNGMECLTAAFAGLIWSLHPLRVESVAWIAERKDVLNGLFALLSIYFYLVSRIRISIGASGFRAFFVSVVCFYLSLGAKSVTVVLPLLLLAIDLYPLRRITLKSLIDRLMEKIPYFAGSVLVVLTTFAVAARRDVLINYEIFPFGQRLMVSGNAIIEYLRFFLFPVGLSPLNVIPDPIPSSYGYKALLALALVIAVVICRRAWIQSCFICFLAPLLPVLAFFQNGDQAFADHFTYISCVAPAIGVAVLFLRLNEKFEKGKKVFLLVTMIMLIACYATLSVRMFAVWRSTESFWSRIIEMQPIAINYKERGRNYHLDGRYAEAIDDFSKALTMLPETLLPYSYNFYAFRAESFRAAGKYDAALADFDTAIHMLPHPVYFHHRALTLKALGRDEEARRDFEKGGSVTYPLGWFDRVD